MRALLDVILLALNLYVWVLIASAVMSWLVAFGVVNMRNDVVRTIWNFLYQVTEPVLGRSAASPEPRRDRHLAHHPPPHHLLHQRVIALYLYPVAF
jgi:YggT family protein